MQQRPASGLKILMRHDMVYARRVGVTAATRSVERRGLVRGRDGGPAPGHTAHAKAPTAGLVSQYREANEDGLRVRLEEGAPERVVFHGFSGDEAMARVCAERGYFMSYAGNVTFKNADDLRAAARVTPRDLLLVETDAPFLTPTPWRGRPNASYLIPVTMRALAELQGADLDDLCGAVMANGRRAFALARQDFVRKSHVHISLSHIRFVVGRS